MKKFTKLMFLPMAAMLITGCDKNKAPEEPADPGQQEPATVEASIALDKTSLTVALGGTKTLVATAANGEGAVVWSSSAVGVASVSQEGVVTGASIGTATITATYSGKTATCTVNVVASEQYRLAQVNENENIKTFKLNVQDEDNEFRGETSAIIEVGDDNAFDVKPKLIIVDKSTLDYVEESYWTFDYSYKLEEFVDEAYVEASSSYVESFDAAKCKINFAESAIGKQFKLTVIPGGLSDAQKANPEMIKTVELKVLDGYNVYSADELAYFNDVTPSGDAMQGGHAYTLAERTQAWVDFRQSKGLDASYVAPGIFLQTDVVIGKENLPSLYFYQSAEETGAGNEDGIGMMKDSTDCYIHEAENFVFNGNYFNVDTENLVRGYGPLMWNPGDGISHSTLFKVAELRDGGETGGETNLSFKNCSYFGNSKRSSDQTYRTGLIFFKVRNDKEDNSLVVKTEFSNFNVTGAVISFYPEYGPSETTFKDCVVTEDYANAIMVHENGDLNFVNSEFRKMGGPIIVTTCNEYTNVGIHIVADEETIFDNYVTGDEPWFVNTQANLAMPTIKQFDDDFLDNSGKTYLVDDDDPETDTKLMNMILANRGDTDLVTFKKGSGAAIGLDKNSPGYDTILGMIESPGAPYGMADNGVSHFYMRSKVADTDYDGKYFDLMLYNALFKHIAAIFEIFDK